MCAINIKASNGDMHLSGITTHSPMKITGFVTVLLFGQSEAASVGITVGTAVIGAAGNVGGQMLDRQNVRQNRHKGNTKIRFCGHYEGHYDDGRQVFYHNGTRPAGALTGEELIQLQQRGCCGPTTTNGHQDDGDFSIDCCVFDARTRSGKETTQQRLQRLEEEAQTLGDEMPCTSTIRIRLEMYRNKDISEWEFHNLTDEEIEESFRLLQIQITEDANEVEIQRTRRRRAKRVYSAKISFAREVVKTYMALRRHEELSQSTLSYIGTKVRNLMGCRKPADLEKLTEDIETRVFCLKKPKYITRALQYYFDKHGIAYKN